ncbi:MAG: hypothetical protein WD066_03750, partial [Planctomycetaceae bacterium]
MNDAVDAKPQRSGASLPRQRGEAIEPPRHEDTKDEERAVEVVSRRGEVVSLPHFLREFATTDDTDGHGCDDESVFIVRIRADPCPSVVKIPSWLRLFDAAASVERTSVRRAKPAPPALEKAPRILADVDRWCLRRREFGVR